MEHKLKQAKERGFNDGIEGKYLPCDFLCAASNEEKLAYSKGRMEAKEAKEQNKFISKQPPKE